MASIPELSNPADEQYQASILPGVSRTFALTIPQLPAGLREAVTNAYLLCRIADTIEDDPELPTGEKEDFHALFRAVVAGHEAARDFAEHVRPRLSAGTPEAEQELIRNTERVISVTHSLRPAQQRALARCVDVMCTGMPEFQRNSRPDGLDNLGEMDRYCYYVAGVVGEMLTELFCDYCPELAPRREEMLRLGVSFGQGLQMTNILKDTWDDRSRGACWLPRDIFLEEGFDLARLAEDRGAPGFAAGMVRLIGIAHEHLQDALRYTLMIPPAQTGMRRFCLWAIGMAILTLDKIHSNPAFTASNEVKISRRAVRATILMTNLATEHDRWLRSLFRWTARNLPDGGRGPLRGWPRAAGADSSPQD
ncbi:MAG TPA: phytoene/squalene synthase family protein [Gammaproteobacteria bacterium]|nr:phytoene/squalene synthase family protein [Gammaproteobacteria bacterium]